MKYQILKALQQIEDLWGLDLPETLEDRIKFLKREFRFLDIVLSLQSFIDLPHKLDVTHKVEALFQDATADLSVNEFHDGDDVINEIQHLHNVTNQLQVKIGMIKLDMRAKYPFPNVYYYDKVTPINVLEFIDTVVGNLGDLLKIYCSSSLLFVPGPKKELGDVFKELKLLRNFVCFVSDRSIEPKSQQTDFFTYVNIKAQTEFFTRVLEVAGRAAMVSWLYLPRNGDDNQDMDPAKMNGLLSDLIRTEIKPILPSISKIYIDVLQALRSIIQSQRYPIVQIEHVADCAAGFVETLKYNLKALPISNPGTHQIADFQEMLDLLIANLSHLSVQELEFHLQDINSVMIDSGLLVYSLCEDVALKEVTIDLPGTIQRIKIVIYHIIRKEFQSNLPRIHGLGYVDFLLNNLKEFQYRYPDALAFVKTQLQTIQTELERLQPFIKSVAVERHNSHGKLHHSVGLLIGKAYEVEYTVDACVSKQVPDWCIELWILDLKEEITAEVAKIQILEIDSASHDTIDTDTSTTSSVLARTQRIDNEIDNEIVGFEDEIRTLRRQLTGGCKRRDIISIVGMPGAGKTTLAKRLYFDELVVSHFDIRVQCYVSPVYSRRGLVLSLLVITNGSIDETSALHNMETDELVDILRRSLYSKRYLILIDDVWHPSVWDDLACCFPEMAMGSRILLTTRNDDVANKVKSVSEPLCLRLLSYEESWELLKMKVFGDECSPLLEEVGQEIARKCGGLPLSIVLVAGILSKMEKTKECWSQVAENLGSYIASDAKAIIEPSYQYLPYHLKPCFLYFGTFLEDKEINISKLTWLWTGEGFVKDLEGHSSQDIAEHYFEDLIHRNLVMDTKSSDGKVKSCRVHGLLLDFCKRRAEEEHLLLWIKRDKKANPPSGICSHEQLVQRRLAFAEVDNLVEWSSSCCSVGSVLYREYNRTDVSSRQVSQICYNFKFLKVLDLESIVIHSFPTVLVYLRYFAAQTAQDSITSLITNLWNLETLILKPTKGKLKLPITIWKMIKLRHVCIDNAYFTLNGVEGLLEKLEILSSPCFSCAKDVELLSRKTLNLRELRCSFVDFRHDFFPKLDFLTHLETLEIHLAADSMVDGPYNFPSSLRNLTLSNFFLGSCHESNISKLPNLQVLKLVSIFFDNDTWDVRDDEFEALKVLKLVKCEFLEEWKAPHNAFPKLEHLVLRECRYLKATPLQFGDITSLKSIKVKSCSESVERSATDIKQHQEDVYMDSGLKDFIEKEKRDRLSATFMAEQVSVQKQVMDDDGDFVEEVSDPKSKNLKPNVPAEANIVLNDVDSAKPSTYLKIPRSHTFPMVSHKELIQKWKYDAFLSFRGEDTCSNFVADLYKRMEDRGIYTFKDDVKLERGKPISLELLKAIEESKFAIIIFSENYASSTRCLQELTKIMECVEKKGQEAIPIFYNVDPSDVRMQRNSFAVAMAEHEADLKGSDMEKVQRWKDVLHKAANIAGWDVRKTANGDESQLIHELVKRVLPELSNSPMIVAPFVVGIDYSLEELIRLLDVKRNGVKILGLHGIAGVGKTTLSKALYNKLACHFTHRTFILNAKEIATQQGIVSLQKKIIQGLFPSKPFSSSPNNAHDGRVKFRRMLQQTRILLVLDDVDYVSDDVNILEALIGGKNWFFEGSRVVISTRNREVLLEDIVNETFEVRELGDTDSLKLFSYHAFKRREPSPPFHNISRQIVSITGRLPLALEVFGSFLFDKRSEEEWLDALEKLKQIRLPRLQDILKISYDGLDDEEKCIFLDVACLFLDQLDKKVEDVIDVMKGCGFRAGIAFDTLTARSLIKVIDGGDLWMHDQIRDMGRQIVRQEGLFNPGNRSRLWDVADVLSVLQGRKGTQHIQGIILNQQHKSSKIKSAKAITREQFQQAPSLSSALAYIKELYKQQFQNDAKETNELVLKTEVFDPIVNLRLLQFDNVKLEGNLGKLPSSLKWLQWKRCNLSSYYSNDYPSELAILDLSESQIERIGSREWTWSRKKAANKLKVMNLSDCHKITAIPDLSMHKALEKLIAERCSALQRIHRAIGNLKTLCHLNLRDCRNLVEFPSEVSGLKNLEKLILSGCLRLKQLPEDIGQMKSLQELLLDGTAIEKLPQSIFHLTKLERLSLNNCHSFKRLPRLLGNLSALKELSLNGSAVEEVPVSIEHLQNLHTLSLIWCRSLAAIPNSVGNVKSLANLWLYGSAIEIMPDSIGSLYYLRSLSLGKCQYLTALPVSIKGLSSLVELRIDNVPIRSLPDHVGALHSLKTLEIRNCACLGSLPHSIGELLALRTMTITRNDAIMELPESVGKLQNLVILRLTKCKRLCKLPSSVGELKNLVHLLMEETAVTVLPKSFGMLSSLMVLRMGKKPFCQVLQSTEITGSATYAETGTAPIVLPASFSELSLLEELDARAWRIAGKIPDDFEKLSYLEIINLGHNDFSHLPSSLKGLHFLKKLLIPHCKQLKALPPLPSSLLEIDTANCGSLESIHEISELKFLRELNLANCMSLVDIQGVECLKSLKMLHMAGCNVSCASIVGSKLDKVAVKNLDNFSIPGTEIPSWFTPSEVHFSRHENNEIKAVIIAIVVSVDCAEPDNLRDELPVKPNIFAKIVRANRPVYTTGMYLKGVPTTPEDQVYLCRYQDYHPLASILEDGDIIQVGLGNLPITGIELKKCGIHLVYECDDDYEGNEESLDESQQSVSERLTRFYGASDTESSIFSSDSVSERFTRFYGASDTESNIFSSDSAQDESQQSVSEWLTRFYGASDTESNICRSDSAQDESQQSVSERLTQFYGVSDRESSIFSSDSAQEDGEGERTHSFFSFVKEIFGVLKYLLFRRFSTHERGFFI